MASGVKVSPEAESTIAKLKTRALRCCTFKLNTDLTHIITDKCFPKDDFPDGAAGKDILECVKAELPPAEPRYALLDFSFQNEESHARESIVFIAWCPDESKTKQKMLYASSKGYFSTALGGNVKMLQASELSDLDFHQVRTKCLK